MEEGRVLSNELKQSVFLCMFRCPRIGLLDPVFKGTNAPIKRAQDTNELQKREGGRIFLLWFIPDHQLSLQQGEVLLHSLSLQVFIRLALLSSSLQKWLSQSGLQKD